MTADRPPSGAGEDPRRSRAELTPEQAHVAQVLDDAARSERALIDQAAELEDAPGTDRVGPTLRQLAAAGDAADEPAPRAASPGNPAGRLWLVALAAGLLALVFFVFDGGDRRGPGPSGVRLGSGSIEIVRPLEGAASWDTIEWVDASGAARRFELRVLDPMLAGPDATLVHERGLTETRWTAPDSTAWPREIRIEIDAYDASDGWLDSVSVSYSR